MLLRYRLGLVAVWVMNPDHSVLAAGTEARGLGVALTPKTICFGDFLTWMTDRASRHTLFEHCLPHQR